MRFFKRKKGIFLWLNLNGNGKKNNKMYFKIYAAFSYARFCTLNDFDVYVRVFVI